MTIESKQIETISVQQLCLLLRSLGMKVSEVTLSSGIQQGVYPFAHCIVTDKGNRRFEVFKKLLDQWIEERVTT